MSGQFIPGEYYDRATFLSPQFGFIVPHTPQMKHLITGHSYGGFIQTLKKTRGNESWKYAYNFPEQGAEVFYNYTGNPKALGSQWALSYICMLPLNKKTFVSNSSLVFPDPKGYRHWLGLGIGTGYVTRIWNLKENHQAPVLGSRINVALTIQYSAHIFSIGSLQMRAGLRVTHFSNGAFQIPNLGTNNLSLYAGVLIGPPRKMNPNDNFALLEKRELNISRTWLSSFSISGGLKEIPPPNGKKHLAAEFNFVQERRLNYKCSVGLGTDVMYNSSLQILMERRDQRSVSKSEIVQLGATGTFVLHFDRVSLRIQQGVYFRDQWKDDGKFYHRFGLRYEATDHLFFQLLLKTHFAKADYGELSIGYTLQKRQ